MNECAYLVRAFTLPSSAHILSSSPVVVIKCDSRGACKLRAPFRPPPLAPAHIHTLSSFIHSSIIIIRCGFPKGFSPSIHQSINPAAPQLLVSCGFRRHDWLMLGTRKTLSSSSPIINQPLENTVKHMVIIRMITENNNNIYYYYFLHIIVIIIMLVTPLPFKYQFETMKVVLIYYIQLSTADLLARASMKNAANCDK
jgi:hypothetical protein